MKYRKTMWKPDFYIDEPGRPILLGDFKKQNELLHYHHSEFHTMFLHKDIAPYILHMEFRMSWTTVPPFTILDYFTTLYQQNKLRELPAAIFKLVIGLYPSEAIHQRNKHVTVKNKPSLLHRSLVV